MQDLSAQRTLVKSPPELWDELSEVERLARHLDAFGEIKITKLEPEHTVAWEGEHASGTVSIEPSGWGTKVVLTAELAEDGGPAEPDPDHQPEPSPAEPEQPESVGVEPVEDVEPAVAEIPPAAALAYDAAGAPAAGAEHARPADPPAERPRRRRGFWARLFAGWLVPEERLNRAAAMPREERLLAALDPPAEEPQAESAEYQLLPAEEEAVVEAAEPPEPPPAEPQPEPADDASSAMDPDDARNVLEATLDALGSAHHRPYSRS
jgi:hypothetical protein